MNNNAQNSDILYDNRTFAIMQLVAIEDSDYFINSNEIIKSGSESGLRAYEKNSVARCEVKLYPNITIQLPRLCLEFFKIKYFVINQLLDDTQELDFTFNMYLDNGTNKNSLVKISLSETPTQNVIKTIVKKENKEYLEWIVKVELESYICNYWADCKGYSLSYLFETSNQIISSKLGLKMICKDSFERRYIALNVETLNIFLEHNYNIAEPTNQVVILPKSSHQETIALNVNQETIYQPRKGIDGFKISEIRIIKSLLDRKQLDFTFYFYFNDGTFINYIIKLPLKLIPKEFIRVEGREYIIDFPWGMISDRYFLNCFINEDCKYSFFLETHNVIDFASLSLETIRLDEKDKNYDFDFEYCFRYKFIQRVELEYNSDKDLHIFNGGYKKCNDLYGLSHGFFLEVDNYQESLDKLWIRINGFADMVDIDQEILRVFSFPLSPNLFYYSFDLETRFDGKQLDGTINYDRIDTVNVMVKLKEQYKHLKVTIYFHSYYYFVSSCNNFILNFRLYYKQDYINELLRLDKNNSQKYLERNNNYKSLAQIFEYHNLPIELVFLVADYLD